MSATIGYQPSPVVGEGVVSLCETTGEGLSSAALEYPSSARFAGTFSHKGRRLGSLLFSEGFCE